MYETCRSFIRISKYKQVRCQSDACAHCQPTYSVCKGMMSHCCHIKHFSLDRERKKTTLSCIGNPIGLFFHVINPLILSVLGYITAKGVSKLFVQSEKEPSWPPGLARGDSGLEKLLCGKEPRATREPSSPCDSLECVFGGQAFIRHWIYSRGSLTVTQTYQWFCKVSFFSLTRGFAKNNYNNIPGIGK